MDFYQSEEEYFKGLTRKKYILKAKEIMERDGSDDISIRELAKEMGCSSAALYRHFDDKQELLYYVSLTTLEDYIVRLNEAEKNWKNCWEIYVGVWDCYCKEAFRHPKDFNRLFFKNSNRTLNERIQEYYRMFPDNIQETNAFFLDMLSTADFYGRDMEMCKRCAQDGAISREDVTRLNRLVCTLYKGYFKGVCDDGIQEEDVDALVRVVIGDIDRIVFSLATDLKGYQGYYPKEDQ